MASLDRNLRRDLENAVRKARRVAEAGARQALDQLAVANHEPWAALTPEQRTLRNRLRAHGRQLGDRREERKGTQTIDRLTGECAYEHWHRLLFARFLAENDLLVEPESGMALSLDECRELAREQSKDWLVLASDFAQRMLPQIFRAGDPVLEVALPPEKRQELEAILEGLSREVFIADDSLGWVYQFWQADEKDAVNASENKIGADELPAVTQLFTEDYMVLFLLHNTLGAWWAGKLLAANPDLAASAASEDELRAACAVQGIEWSYLRFVREVDAWRPAAGTFPDWPSAAKDLTVLDPCMGSGHFLAFALPMLVALRREEEKLSVAAAIDAVLRDNLFGLELDPRCTQIAAFNVALSTWKLTGHRALPAMHLACSGLTLGMSKSDWLQLAEQAAHELPEAPRRELFGSNDNLFSLAAKNGMEALYDLFAQAPVLGSLIDPHRSGKTLLQTGYAELEPLFKTMLGVRGSDEMREAAVAAQGMAKAADILGRRFTLVITNVPYLGRGRQSSTLQAYCERVHSEAKGDLAVVFVERCLALAAGGGAASLVTPQSWLFMNTYKKVRRRILADVAWTLVARLGPGAFETISGAVVNVALVALGSRPAKPDHCFAGIELAAVPSAAGKAAGLRSSNLLLVKQSVQLENPDSRIVFESGVNVERLSAYCSSFLGLGTGDYAHYGRCFWEFPEETSGWAFQLCTVDVPTAWGGREHVLAWDSAAGRVRGMTQAERDQIHNQDQSGRQAWGKRGVAVGLMQDLRPTLYAGEPYEKALAVLVPTDDTLLPAIWAYCTDPSFNEQVRKLEHNVIVANGTLVKIPFDVKRWQQVAADRFGNRLPEPRSEEATQWLFDGSVRTAAEPLLVAVARLLGYRWPRQTGSSFVGCASLDDDGLDAHADNDGIVCLPSLRGEPTAAGRLKALLADAFGAEWSVATLSQLLAGVEFGGRTLDDWLRDGFFEQHCAHFHQRPFVWQIWDGRKDGFSALVNYHRLAAPNGEGRRILERLTHTYLGDWLDRQRADQNAGVEGADGRVAAAEHLKRELEKILEGEPPYDIFVRWKPLHQQPVGWEPDIDDGVRMNIRPFMNAKPLNARGKNACILRVAPKIKWDKDRGREAAREKADFPWFWAWDEETPDFPGGSTFDGNRWNDLHYSRAAKLAARERPKGGKP